MKLNLPSTLPGLVLGATAFMLLAPSALAVEPTLVPDQDAVLKDDKKKEGWDFGLRVGASIAFSNTMNVVGKQDGNTFTFGLNADGNVDFVQGKHDWRNTLSISETFSSTPVVPDIVTTQDKIFLESLYSWKGLPWLGPFARVAMRSSLLPGFDHQLSKVEYGTLDAEGNFQGEGRTRSRKKLTRPFLPLTLKQSVGGFARPYDEPFARIDIRAGIGAQEVFAEGGNTVTNVDAELGQVTLSPLSDSLMLGVEIAAYIEGKVLDDKVSYKAGGEVLIPFVEDSAIDHKPIGDRINVSLEAALSFKLVEWASVDYQLAVLRQPQVVEEWQVTNQLLLTFGYTLVD